jgi:cell division protein ZipA
MSYIILLALLALIALSIYRASQHKAISRRRDQEPNLGLGANYAAAENLEGSAVPSLEDLDEEVGPVRYVSQSEPATNINNIIIINLFADPDKPYRGYELLQALLSCSLRYGKRGIFHRQEKVIGGPILFSVASAVEPGIFDLPKISSFSTPGLTLFTEISKVQNPAQVLSLMLKTAKDLTNHLGGQILDADRQPLSLEKITAWQNAL